MDPTVSSSSSRRQFLASVGAGLAALPFSGAWSNLAAEETKPSGKRKRLAVVTTLWTQGTHAWHMPERFLHGYPVAGRWHRPEVEIVAAYVDQRPKNDLSAGRAEEFGFKVYPTVAEALRVGGAKLDVDGVVLIGEHGDYPDNEYGQKFYPRYELFKKITDVYRADGRSVPIFNDKHLSWSFAYAKEMVDTARELNFPLQAGSSLPVTWRMPAIDLPRDAEVEEALVVGYGGLDSYDFHALETLQSFIERRRGGETGVASVEAMRGEGAWQLIEATTADDRGIDPNLFEACLARSHTLAQPATFSHRFPSQDERRRFVKNPIAFRIRYNDGLRATMLLMSGLVQDFTVAARLKRPAGEIISTQMHLPPNPNVAYSAALMYHAERMFVTGKTQYPIERTLLTSGLLQSGLQSLYKKQELKTPHLNISYKPTAESTFFRS
jgi:hypothetical protein